MDKVKRQLRALYVMQAFDAAAFSLIGIFVPVMLLINGASLRAVLWFFVIHNLVLLGTAFLSGYIATLVGLGRAMLMRLPFLIVYLLLLVYWETLSGPVFLLAAVSGAQAGLYWAPLNVLFNRASHVHNVGETIGKLSVVPQLAGLVGPLLGAVIAQTWGFRSLFGLAFVLSVAGCAPLLMARPSDHRFRFKPSEGLMFFTKTPKRIVLDILDNFGGEAEGILWPIFVFLVVQDLSVVGLVGTLLALGAMLFNVFVGKLADKVEPMRIIRFVVPLIAVVWLLRFFAQDHFTLLATTVLSGFLLTLFSLPYTIWLYKAAKLQTHESFFIVKELPTVTGRLIFFLIALALADHIQWVFLLAAAAYLSFLLFVPKQVEIRH